MKLWKSIFLAGVVGLAASAEVSTNFYAHIDVAKTNVFLGEVFPVNVIVKAPDFPEAPKTDALEAFNVKPLNAGTKTSEADTYVFQYSFRAKKEGLLTIPPLLFTAGGADLSTEPVGMLAKKPQKSDRMSIVSTLSATNCYVGEPVLLTTTWDSSYPLNAIKAVDFHFPVLHDKRFQTLEPYEPEKEKDTRTTGLPVYNTRVLAIQKSFMVDEVQYQSLSFNKILIPKRSGTIEIPQSRLLCAATRESESDAKRGRRTAFQYPAYFDNTFFDQNLTGGGYNRVYAESNPLTLEVKPLPAEGRPPQFKGLIGSFTIDVQAEPLSVRVGEPVTLTVRIESDRFMETINFPSLRYQPQLINKFEIPDERSLPELAGKAKISTQSIRPVSTTVSNIPPLELVFFNPASNAFMTATSEPIPLTVSEAVLVAEYGTGEQQYRSRLKTVTDGIRHNYENPDMLISRKYALFGWAHPIAVCTIVLVPPILFGTIALLAFFGKKKHNIRRTAKAARAYRIYRKNAAAIAHLRTKSEIYMGLDQTLRAYLGDRLHKRPGALTFRGVEKKLAAAGTDFQTVEKLESVFEICEAYRFTAGFDENADAKQIVHAANRIVKAVERNLK
ncbi:MAG: BatD family protein [Kiritimatiellales bacterium]|nr:BatD family protein [Kiritimatiellales bacterium]